MPEIRGRRQVLLPAMATVGYVALVALRKAPHVDLATLGTSCAALALAYLTSRVRSRELAWTLWGAALVLAARGVPFGSLAIAGAVGAGAATAGGLVALHRIPTFGGVLRDRARSPRLGLIVLGLLWFVAIAVSLFGLAPVPEIGRILLGAAGGMSTLILMGVAAASRLERHLELGVAPRLSAFLLATTALAVIALVASALGIAPPTAACLALAATSGVAASVFAQLGDPVKCWRLARRVTALTALGALVALFFGFTPVVIGATCVAIVLGASVRPIERASDADASRRLHAVRKASRALEGCEADQALFEVLRALRQATPPPPIAETGPRRASAELWTLDPVRCLRVDAAGYPHDEAGELPPELLVIACREPEGTLRAEALVALEVRRPDLRALSRWMQDARFSTATVIARAGEPEGLLFMPAYDGAPLSSLEEVRALRTLADALAPLCHARGLLSRSMRRERDATRDAEQSEERALRLEHALARASAQHTLAATRLARPAAIGVYSAASRLAFEALERRTRAQAPIVVIAPSGVDPIPLLARAHLSGARASGPLVLVDGTSSREHDLERWRDPEASPLALADGGMLALIDGAALPADVQRLIGQALAERRAPWERPEALDIVLVMTCVAEPAGWIEEGRIDRLLASRFGDAIEELIRLPGISERPEDIRALVTDRLAREGLRVRGYPLGIEDAAFVVLVEHPFEGEDAELTAVIQRLVAQATGNVVRERDVRAVLSSIPLQTATEPDALRLDLSRKRGA